MYTESTPYPISNESLIAESIARTSNKIFDEIKQKFPPELRSDAKRILRLLVRLKTSVTFSYLACFFIPSLIISLISVIFGFIFWCVGAFVILALNSRIRTRAKAEYLNLIKDDRLAIVANEVKKIIKKNHLLDDPIFARSVSSEILFLNRES